MKCKDTFTPICPSESDPKLFAMSPNQPTTKKKNVAQVCRTENTLQKLISFPKRGSHRASTKLVQYSSSHRQKNLSWVIRGWIGLLLQSNHARVHLKPDQDHLTQSTTKCFVWHPNVIGVLSPALRATPLGGGGGGSTSFWFTRAKHCMCESMFSTLRHNEDDLEEFLWVPESFNGRGRCSYACSFLRLSGTGTGNRVFHGGCLPWCRNKIFPGSQN